jgi:hypothetical protein
MSPRVTSKYRFLFSIAVGAALLFLCVGPGVTGGEVHAQDIDNDYLTVVNVTTDEGVSLTETIIHGPPVPPPGFEAERAAVTDIPAMAKVLTAPAYTWVFGCSSVSGAMIAGYYDRNGYANMYAGPTDSGVMPMTDSSWPTWSDGYTTYPNNPLIASHKGVDGRSGKGSIDDYWVKYGSTANDPYITGGWTQHKWGTAIGDYMKTSQSGYSNTDGSTSFFNYNSATKLTCSKMTTLTSGGKKISTLDGTYGRKLFYQKRGYTVTDCFNQSTDNKYTGGFSLANYKAQIDAGNPVLLNLAGHSIVGVGYSGSTIYIHDTWDTSNHTMTWGGSYSGMELQSVSVVNLDATAVPTPLEPSGTISDKTPTYTWSKVSGATSYQYQLKKGTSKIYTKTVSSSACGTTNCSNTPTTTLNYATYKWRVRAKVGGTWKAWSAFKTFKIALPVPTPKSPSGTISDRTPTYKWTKESGSTRYQFQLKKGTTSVYKKAVSSSACSGTTCSNTPTTTLNYATYKWRVRAKTGGTWGGWSALKKFTIEKPSTGFSSSFNGSHTGWEVHKGKWLQRARNYRTAGVSEKYASISYKADFTTLTYQAKLKRVGSAGNANYISLRGTVTPLNSTGTWYKEYKLQYSNDGYFSVWKGNGSSRVALQGWTATPAIVQNGWNKLKVTATGSTLKFYINGSLVYSTTDSTLTSGRVGLGMYRDTSGGNMLYADWAKLSTTVADVSGEVMAPMGPEVGGTEMFHN